MGHVADPPQRPAPCGPVTGVTQGQEGGGLRSRAPAPQDTHPVSRAALRLPGEELKQPPGRCWLCANPQTRPVARWSQDAQGPRATPPLSLCGSVFRADRLLRLCPMRAG